MTITFNWNTVFATIATFIALAGWIVTWKKAAMGEGAHKKEIEQMKKDLVDLEKKEEYLRGCTEENSGTLREVKRDIDWIRAALSRIEILLQTKTQE